MQKYIDLQWHTVPLKGQLKRLEDGSKTIPIFEENWREKYTTTFNESAAPLGGVITGAASNIIAIDCDNTLTWDLFRSLDPDYEFVFISKGKGDKRCGTIIYEYTSEHRQNFRVNDDLIQLDFYSNEGFVYLPTAANKTKVTLHSPLPQIKPVPETVSALLVKLRRQEPEPTLAKKFTNVATAPCLAPILERSKKGFNPGLFKIITPRDFRDLPQYAKKGYLHPDEVPDGRGSEYLSKVSAILGADISVDTELYCEMVHKVNELFSNPINSDRLDRTIIDPMITGKASIDGTPIWAYDENWEQVRLLLTTKRQATIDICFDDKRATYYSVDESSQRHHSFIRDSELISFINSSVISPPKKPEIMNRMSIINTVSEPHRAYGFYEGDDPTARMFNTFIQTPEMYVFTNPDIYAPYYRRPNTTIKFFETLVPEEKMRNYLLQFIKHKLGTFRYSPVILYFLGVHGSGKDTFVQILETVLGNIARPSAKEFLEKHNGWITDTYFAQLDEYGNQLTRIAEKEEALGRLKAYTGKRDVQIRQMRADGYMYKHNMTFIMTANKNPLMLEDGDRRIALFNTPNVLASQEWVHNSGGMAEVHEQIMREVKDFMYWLAKEVPDIDPQHYMKPIESASKHDLIATSMYAAQRLAYAFKHELTQHLIDLGEEFANEGFVSNVNDGRVTLDNLEELYMDMTEHNGDMRSLNKVLRTNGIDIKYTTVNGRKIGYIRL